MYRSWSKELSNIYNIYNISPERRFETPGCNLTYSRCGQYMPDVTGRTSEPRIAAYPHKGEPTETKPLLCKFSECTSYPFLYNTEPLSEHFQNMPKLIPLSKLAERNAPAVCNNHAVKRFASDPNLIHSELGVQYIHTRMSTTTMMSGVNDGVTSQAGSTYAVENGGWEDPGFSYANRWPQINKYYTVRDSHVDDGQTDDGKSQVIVISDSDTDGGSKEISRTSRAKKYGEVSGPLFPVCVEDANVTRCRLDCSLVQDVASNCPISGVAEEYPPELEAALLGVLDYGGVDDLELELTASFRNSRRHCWREGRVKSSFVYLLLDPRVTQNLPQRARNLDETGVFQTFIRAIFYVGKGKRGRTHDHLYSALSHLHRPGLEVTGNVKYILDIWKSQLGVISIQCYHNTVAVEAYTREACIIDAIGLSNLTNKKRGVCYGQALAWSYEIRRVFGVHLLRRALQIFLCEGERQIGPLDVKPCRGIHVKSCPSWRC